MERKNEEFSNSGRASKLVGPNQAENIDKNFAWDNFVLRICIALPNDRGKIPGLKMFKNHFI